jgi:hypothetical protein
MFLPEQSQCEHVREIGNEHSARTLRARVRAIGGASKETPSVPRRNKPAAEKSFNWKIISSLRRKRNPRFLSPHGKQRMTQTDRAHDGQALPTRQGNSGELRTNSTKQMPIVTNGKAC